MSPRPGESRSGPKARVCSSAMNARSWGCWIMSQGRSTTRAPTGLSVIVMTPSGPRATALRSGRFSRARCLPEEDRRRNPVHRQKAAARRQADGAEGPEEGERRDRGGRLGLTEKERQPGEASQNDEQAEPEQGHQEENVAHVRDEVARTAVADPVLLGRAPRRDALHDAAVRLRNGVDAPSLLSHRSP